ncbi:hypothetical protein MNBD_GAMMA15-710 [hydrothermal vent metagenome]|uniref:Uncharacterized protein n=1 Tax=hydrothermal vent metagenome TaxID=652676 RepID=A0A3B0YEB2_9ZZZZ
MAKEENATGSNITDLSAIGGGLIKPVYSQRNMKVYSIQESEIKHISGLNLTATIAFSVGSAFFGFSATIWLEAAFNEKLTDKAQVLVDWGPAAGIVIGVFAFIVGGIALFTRGSILQTIRDESK